VITDLNMPVMDGISLIRGIRSRSKSRFTPVLMLTTESQEQKKREGQAAGASGWIVKPFRPEHLLKTIENLVPQ
jgi:two-component system chemotaxis response regulator CheY